jgi:hypothetical protein
MEFPNWLLVLSFPAFDLLGHIVAVSRAFHV